MAPLVGRGHRRRERSSNSQEEMTSHLGLVAGSEMQRQVLSLLKDCPCHQRRALSKGAIPLKWGDWNHSSCCGDGGWGGQGQGQATHGRLSLTQVTTSLAVDKKATPVSWATLE